MKKLSAAAAAAKVELSSAAAAEEHQQKVEHKLQMRLSKLLAEEQRHKEQVAASHGKLLELKQQMFAAEQQLAVARAAMPQMAATGSARAAIGDDGAVQQLGLLAAEICSLQQRKGVAAKAASDRAGTVRTLHATLEELAAAAELCTQCLQQSHQTLQAATACCDKNDHAAKQAEQAWQQAHLELRLLQVCSFGSVALLTNSCSLWFAKVHSSRQDHADLCRGFLLDPPSLP